MDIANNIAQIKSSIPANVTLVAVSKTKPTSDIMAAYNAGHRVFGENKIQELTLKYEEMPKDIEWHMIGHVQTNKIKYIAPFVSLIHGVDREKVLKEIQKQAAKNNRTIQCLLQVHIAKEETKFGFSPEELEELFKSDRLAEYPNVQICGLMGMATNTKDENQVLLEFKNLKQIFDQLKETFNLSAVTFNTVSMGMSGDYKLAIQEGSTMIRVGSSIFGARNY